MIPLSIKIPFTLFMLVLVPVYWSIYGPLNFLYMCDLALFFTLAGLWLEKPLLFSMAGVGIIAPQLIWMFDFIMLLVTGKSFGMADYMAKESIPLFVRIISFYHFWLPIFLFFLIRKYGYQKQALWAWTGFIWCVLILCYFISPMPPADPANPNAPVNVNYVFGPSSEHAQTWMNPHVYIVSLMFSLFVLVYWPSNWVLNKLYGRT